MEKLVNDLKFTPCFPEEWPSVTISYRFKSTTYNINVYQKKNIENSWWKIGNEQGKGNMLPLKDDGAIHEAEIYILI